jgi:hypothetical protein
MNAIGFQSVRVVLATAVRAARGFRPFSPAASSRLSAPAAFASGGARSGGDDAGAASSR